MNQSAHRIVNVYYKDCFVGEVRISESEWQAYPQQMPQDAVDRICESFEIASCDPAYIRLNQFH